jgi:ankyrin repeat protein
MPRDFAAVALEISGLRLEDRMPAEDTHVRLVAELGRNGGQLRAVDMIVGQGAASDACVASVRENREHLLLHLAVQNDSDVRIVQCLVAAFPALLAQQDAAGHNAFQTSLRLQDPTQHPNRYRMLQLDAKYRAQCVMNVITLQNLCLAGCAMRREHECRVSTLIPITPFATFNNDIYPIIYKALGDKSDAVAATYDNLLENAREVSLFLAHQMAMANSGRAFDGGCLLHLLSWTTSPELVRCVATHTSVQAWEAVCPTRTPLLVALQQMTQDSGKNTAIVRVLLHWRPGDLFVLHNRQSPLKVACGSTNGRNTPLLFELLLAQPGDVVNTLDENRRTPLHRAVLDWKLHRGCVETLVSKATRATLLGPRQSLCTFDTAETPLDLCTMFIDTHLKYYGTRIIEMLVHACPEAVAQPSNITNQTPLCRLVIFCCTCPRSVTLENYLAAQRLVHLFVTACPASLFVNTIPGVTAADIAMQMCDEDMNARAAETVTMMQLLVAQHRLIIAL